MVDVVVVFECNGFDGGWIVEVSYDFFFLLLLVVEYMLWFEFGINIVVVFVCNLMIVVNVGWDL